MRLKPKTVEQYELQGVVFSLGTVHFGSPMKYLTKLGWYLPYCSSFLSGCFKTKERIDKNDYYMIIMENVSEE